MPRVSWPLLESRERHRYRGNLRGYGGMRMDEGGATAVERAQDAASRGEWKAAFELLMSADAAGLVDPPGLPFLADVAYAAGHLDVTIEVWERAHAAGLHSGDDVAAAGAAVRVALHLLFDTALMAPVRGWLARAERLLEGKGRTPADAWFAVVRTYERMLTGDADSARTWARRAVDLGSEHDPAACAIGRVAEARLLILDGQVVQGLALLDDAGTAMHAGDLDRSRRESCTASWCAPSRASRSTTVRRSGPRRWNGGAARMRSGACTGAAASTGPRSSGCAECATRPRPKCYSPVTSCGPICVESWDGR